VRDSQPKNISRRRSRRQGLLTRREQVRLAMLVALLAALVVAGRELGTRTTPPPPSPGFPEIGTAGPEKSLLDEVAEIDYQKLGVEDNPEALRLLLDWVSSGGPGAASSVYASYSDLIEFPGEYRGKGVFVEGQVIRVAESAVPGVLIEGQLMDGGRDIYSFFAPTELGLFEGASSRLYAVFYRIAGYENRKGELEVTPLLILWGAEPVGEAAPWWKWGAAAVAVTALIVFGVFLVSRYEAEDRRRFRQEVRRRRSSASNGTPNSAV